MGYIPHIIGILGVLAFVISYQQRTGKGIIACTVTARTLFVIQYILLGAYEGAAQNGVGALSAILAENKEKRIFAGRVGLWLGFIYVLTVGVGILSWKSPLSFLPIMAMILQNTALWMKKPKAIRLLCLAGIPLWLTYNFISHAYSSMACDILSAVSIGAALIRYDLKKKE